MLLDNVMIAMTLGGLFLSAIYINAEFEQARASTRSQTEGRP
jgi:hypothetical protein